MQTHHYTREMCICDISYNSCVYLIMQREIYTVTHLLVDTLDRGHSL